MVSSKIVEHKICSNCARVYNSVEDFYSGTSRWRLCDRKNLWFNCSCESTLMIPAGKFTWYSPEKHMSGSAISVFNSLSALKNLPHIRNSIMEVQQLLQEDGVEIATLAKKVKGDPVIAANVLTLANNIKSNRDPFDRKKIESLEHAIMFIGKKTLGELVVTAFLQSFESKCKVFNVDIFWKEAFLVGNLAEAISDYLGETYSKDELFISASLCNIGKFVGALCTPSSVDAVQERIDNPKTLSTWQAAEKHLGVPDHCVLGEIGALLWGLPTYVVEATSNHHTLKSSKSLTPQKAVRLSMQEIIAFANQMSHWVLLRPSRIDQKVLDNLCSVAKISKVELDKLGEALANAGRHLN